MLFAKWMTILGVGAVVAPKLHDSSLFFIADGNGPSGRIDIQSRR